MPNRKRPEIGKIVERSIAGGLSAVNEAERTAELSFSSERPVEMYYGMEILCHDAESVNMSRLQDIGVLLFNHNRDYVLGTVLNASIDTVERKCHATVKFDTDEEADKIFQKVLNKTLRGVSVRYSVDVCEEVQAGAMSSNGRFAGPVDVVTRWTPYEISIVSIPADDSVGVGRSGDDEGDRPHSNPPFDQTQDGLPREREQEVTSSSQEGADNEERSGAEASDEQNNAGRREVNMPVDEVVDVAKERQSAMEAERTRAAEITALCREFEIDPAEHISSGRSLDEVRAAVLEEMKKRRAPLNSAPRVEVTVEAVEKFRDAAPDAILMRSGIDMKRAGIEKINPIAGDIRHMTIRSMMEECLRLQGVQGVARMSHEELMKRAMSPDSQFSSILDNTVGKSMMAGHATAETTYQEWVNRGSNPNFKATTRYRKSEAKGPEEVGQSGEIEFAETSDEGVRTQLSQYAIRWGFSMKALIDDDLGILVDMPMAYARAARREINKQVYAVLNNNAAIYDGTALFAQGHGNLASQGAAPGVGTIGDGRAAMRKQKDISGEAYLNISPKFLIAGVDVETTAAQLIASPTDPSGNNSLVINPFHNKLVIVSDAEISDTDSWYLAGDPNVTDTIEVTTLNGNDVPVIQTTEEFGVLGRSWRLYIAWGITVLDYRALYKNEG